MNRRQFSLVPVILLSGKEVTASKSTPEANATPTASETLDPRMQYQGSQTDILDEPWLVGDFWVELGLKDIERYPGDEPGTFNFHDGQLQVEFQSVITAVAGWSRIIIGTHTDLSEIADVYTAIVQGYYVGEGMHQSLDIGYRTAILEAVVLYSNESPKHRN